MPTLEQMLYAQWMIVESQVEYILTAIEDTELEHMEKLISTIHEGCRIVQMQMKHKFQEEDDCDCC